MVEQKKDFYDLGWNARVKGEPFLDARLATRNWRDGWKDADWAETNAPESFYEMD